jgi:hypothetical protein
MRTSVFAQLACAASFLLASEARAQLLVAPPIVPKDLDAAKGVVEEAIGRELAAASINPLAIDEKTFNELGNCKNKMSCLAQIAKPKGASHVLHVILARKDEEVLAQLTVLGVEKAKAVSTVRGKSGLGLTLIEGAVTNAVRDVIKTLKGLPQFKGGGDVVSASLPSIPGSNKDPGTPGASRKAEKEPKAPPPAEPPPPERTVASAPPPAASPPPISASTHVEHKRGTNWVAYSVIGAGVAAGIVGGVMLGLAASDLNKRNQTPQVEVDTRKSLLDAGQGKHGAATGLLIGGGVAIAAGVVMQLLGWGASSGPAVTPTAHGSVTGAAFAF